MVNKNLSKGCLSLFNHFIDMSPMLMSPFFVEKNMFFFLQKHVFLTKNGLINLRLMSIKWLNKERQPLVYRIKRFYALFPPAHLQNVNIETPFQWFSHIFHRFNLSCKSIKSCTFIVQHQIWYSLKNSVEKPDEISM